MSRHNAHLSSYVKSKQKSKNRATQPTITTTRCATKKSTSPNFILPDEIVSKIFTFLTPSQILICARVCKQWNAVSNEMTLWVHHYNLIPRTVRDSILPKERAAPTFRWKSEIIKRTVIQRNKKVKAMLKKIHVNPYSGLSARIEQALKFMSIKWQLCFTDQDDQQYNFINDDMFFFASSLTARWCTFQVPSIQKLKTIAISALTPVFYHRDWKAHSDSATKNSLLIILKISDLKLTKEKCTSQDEMITLHTVHPGIMLGIWKSSWKGSADLAFLSVCIHYHQLVERIIHGQRESVYSPLVHKPVVDDIDPFYGLHRYAATVELRNQRKLFWGNHYRELFRKDFTDEYLALQSHKEQEGLFNVKTSLPWKTPVFKNILNDMVVVDLTLLDEHQEPMWCISSPVKVNEVAEEEVNYTYSDGKHSCIEYKDNIGKLRLELIWIEEDHQNIVKILEIHLRKSYINHWFGTNY